MIRLRAKDSRRRPKTTTPLYIFGRMRNIATKMTKMAARLCSVRIYFYETLDNPVRPDFALFCVWWKHVF